MVRQTLLLLTLAAYIANSNAVINKEPKRREASISSSYHRNNNGPIPVYGVPSPVGQYLPPTSSDILPSPSQMYLPPQQQQPPFKSLPSKTENNFQSLSQKTSFADQIRQHFNLKQSYGPPQQTRPAATYLVKHMFKPNQNYRPPIKQKINFGSLSSSHQGLPFISTYLHPANTHSVPQSVSSEISNSYGPPYRNKPIQAYGPPLGLGSHHSQGIEIHHQSNSHGPIVSCDGWKPIANPVGHISSQDNHHSSYLDTLDDQLVAVALQAELHGENEHNNNNIGQSHAAASFHTEQHQNVDVVPSTSYGVPSKHLQGPSSSSSYSGLDETIIAGLIPPSHNYHLTSQREPSKVIGIQQQHPSVNGNLKQWKNSGLPPKRPVSFRPPVPQGLIESIGASVQHYDHFGIKPHNSPGTYIPPPPAEVPQRLDFSKENHISSSFTNNIALTQALPNYQEPRFNQVQDCGHGPNLNNQYSSLSHNHDVSSNNIINGYNNDFSNQHISLGQQSEINFASPSDSYGPPPSGNPAELVGYESKHSIATAPIHVPATDDEVKTDELPGLGDLNVLSAQRSHSLSLPNENSHGSYELQFQSSNPHQYQNSNNDGSPNHEQILSEGLLQSIISAIEQPNNEIKQNTLESRADHKDADDFLNSPAGQKVLFDAENNN